MTAAEPALTQHKVTVLLVDDQPIIGEAVRRMLAGEDDIAFHYCKDATQALARAKEIGPTVILQDLVMPEIDGLTLVKHFREDEATRETPMIVLSTKEEPKIKAEAFGLGANDYIVKLPDRLELLARIRHHSKGYINLLQRNEAYRALQASQKLLAKDVAQAAKYVYSLLPEKLKKGDDPDRLAVHPLGRAGGRLVRLRLGRRRPLRLLPARRQRPRRRRRPALGLGPERPPVAVAPADRLPRARPGPHRAEQGVPDGAAERPVLHDLVRDLPPADPPARLRRRRPPPALLLTGPDRRVGPPGRPRVAGADGRRRGRPRVHQLDRARSSPSACSRSTATAPSRSSGPTARAWPFGDFLEFMEKVPRTPEQTGMDGLIRHARELKGSDEFADDLSMVEFLFPPGG